MSMRHEYFLIETKSGDQFRVLASIDMKAIVTRLGGKARRSKSGKATAMHGAIVVEEMRSTPPTKGERHQCLR